jgi:hypothetical protein
VDLIKELDGPNLLMVTMLLSKETFMGTLNALKVAWENEFTETIKIFEEEVEKWLVWYINRNDEVDDTLHESGMDLREFENELFEIKTKHQINVAPLREYIEERLKKALIKIVEPKNQETIAVVMPPQPQHAYIKETPPSK